MMLVAKPKDPAYSSTCDRVFDKMEHVRLTTAFKPEESNHDRGAFVAINDGIHGGQGAAAPHRLNTGPHAPLMKQLREDPDVVRLAGYQSSKSVVQCTECRC